MYSIGDPLTKTKRPERYATGEEADIAAIEASQDGRIWAVFDEEEDGEIVSLVYEERVFD